MALLHNTVIQSAMLGRRMAGTEGILPLAGLSRMERKCWYAGGHTPDRKSGVVDGGLPPVTWSMPVVAGGMSSRNFANLAITPTASGAMGLPGSATASFAIDFAPADGQLITSGSGTASFAVSAEANALATLNGDGSASMAFTTNTPLLGAIGWVTATGAFSVSTTMTAYAKGFMVGSTIDNTTLTAAALIAAMNADPPKVNIAKVNDVVVTGTGAVGDEWGP